MSSLQLSASAQAGALFVVELSLGPHAFRTNWPFLKRRFENVEVRFGAGANDSAALIADVILT
ncbi:hypothetical protein P350_35695 [Burkholderia cepacia JBK9]|uniref:Uncharacterized protein n=1 Tax=Burkholderia arboris TaxID=488730 RepID=A0ABZ3DYY2_9BURK|nr:hypothetical protein [Burkholderia arboris]ALX16968.1 hypothetical protein P350_35695 [Burkholderia cepacia JBK9]MCA8489138.1 hypothetical protein [Burkholderia arboris]